MTQAGTVSGPSSVLKDSVKVAIAAARDKRWDDFYGAYASLFQSADFSAARVDDQRQALKLMIATKGVPPPTSQSGIDAYQAAWYALSRIVSELGHPGDYELLGLVHLRLQDEDGARKVFQAGLEIAQNVNDLDLCGAFLRHLSTL